jgi:hypothetical protein
LFNRDEQPSKSFINYKIFKIMHKNIKNAGIVMIFLSILAINLAFIGDKTTGLSGQTAMILAAVDAGGGTSGGGTSGGGTGTGGGTGNGNVWMMLKIPVQCPSGYENHIKCTNCLVISGAEQADVCTSSDETPCPNCTTPGHDWVTESNNTHKYCKRCNIRITITTNTGSSGCKHNYSATDGSPLASCTKCGGKNVNYCTSNAAGYNHAHVVPNTRDSYGLLHCQNCGQEFR